MKNPYELEHECLDYFNCDFCHEQHSGSNLEEMKSACGICAEQYEEDLRKERLLGAA